MDIFIHRAKYPKGQTSAETQNNRQLDANTWKGKKRFWGGLYV
jgi:hypothetical protein